MQEKLRWGLMFIAVILTLSLSGCASLGQEEEPEPAPEPEPEAPVEPDAPALRGLRIQPGAPILDIGDTVTLQVSTRPTDAELDSLSWETSDPQVAGVSGDGTLTAVNAGTATVTARVEASQSATAAAGEGDVVRDDITVVVKDRLDLGNRSLSFAFVPAVSLSAAGTGGSSAGLALREPVWMLDAPVTYALWTEVYTWATQDTGDGTRADGGPLYEIASIGRRGNDGAQEKSARHPVTRVSWRSAVVWANALTEYVNASSGSSLEPVYYESDRAERPLRSAGRAERIRRDVLYSQDNPFVKQTADGFRLPDATEWEIAARYIVDVEGDGALTANDELYPEAFASGADAAHGSSAQTDGDGDGTIEETSAVAIYRENADGSTAEVASLRPNGLGIYDMSGNVAEWVFDWDPNRFGSYRTLRGGSWESQSGAVATGASSYARPWFEDGGTGLRVVRSALRIPVRTVDLPDETVTIPQGQRRELTAAVEPPNAYNQKLSWETSNPEVAPVTDEGLVTGSSVGQATITVTAADGGLQDSVIVEVRVSVTGVSLNRQSASLFVGESEQLEASISPENAANRELRWSSADPDVARVSQDGRVTGVSVGTATITVTTVEGGYSANFTAVVKESLQIAGQRVNMVSVPSATFPMGLNDDRRGRVEERFRIAETEVTEGLWEAVYSWAVDEGGYRFLTAGRQGGYWPERVETNTSHPVTELDWQSALVWTNALTEYYNAQTDSELRPVYYTDQALSEPVRNAEILGSAQTPGTPSTENRASIEGRAPFVDAEADGFRLPESREWELAARFKGSDRSGGAFEFPPESGRWWTPGNYAAGAEGSVDDAAATRAVAVVSGIPGSTAEVASLAANALGLYDMSGNIAEWTLTQSRERAVEPLKRGGSWYDSLAGLRVSRIESVGSSEGIDGFTAGLRVARSVAPESSEETEESAQSAEERAAEAAESETSPEVPPETPGEPNTVLDEPAASPEPPPVDTRSPATSAEEPAPGTVQAFFIGDLRIELVYAPPGTVPTGLDDSGAATVGDAFWLGRREVSYELWRRVREWAQGRGYRIPSEGARHILLREGDAPVGRVSWRAALVWTNALTELVTANGEAELEPVYYADPEYSKVIRSAGNQGAADDLWGHSDAPFVKDSASGFRLPTSAEWTLAARYSGKQNDKAGGERSWLSGSWVSGMPSAEADPTRYAVFNTTVPKPVASTQANALGIFDLSGNVEEFVFDIFPGSDDERRVVRGGSFISSRPRASIGRRLSIDPGDDLYLVTGLRIARSAQP
jgi:formylglycine-generating enzyme required for sulfatase activity